MDGANLAGAGVAAPAGAAFPLLVGALLAGGLPEGGTDPAALLVGAGSADDAAVFRLSDDIACVLTTDFFTPVVDDPYDFGRIAAANALSDVYAMGGEPRVCLNLMAFPRALGLEVAAAVLRGSGDVVAQAGALVAGGHTVEDAEPKFGLCVMGVVHPERILQNGGARPGDVLFLTKPVGTGVMTTALKRGRLDEEGIRPVVDLMATLNAAAGRVVRAHALAGAVHACTDVTGFGLAGHAHEMCAGSDCGLELRFADVPLIEGARGFAAEGVTPGKTRDVRAWAEGFTEILPAPGRKAEEAADDLRCAWNLLADPQTSGGLLVAVDPTDADAFAADLAAAGAPAAARIGAFIAGEPVIRVQL